MGRFNSRQSARENAPAAQDTYAINDKPAAQSSRFTPRQSKSAAENNAASEHTSRFTPRAKQPPAAQEYQRDRRRDYEYDDFRMEESSVSDNGSEYNEYSDYGRDTYPDLPAEERKDPQKQSAKKPAEKSGGKGKLIAAVVIGLLIIGVNIFIINKFNVSLKVVASVELAESEHSLFEGESIAVQADVLSFGLDEPTLLWSVDNENIATVDTNGKVTAVAPGTVTLTVTEPDSLKSDTCTITVHSLGDIILDSTQLILGSGESVTLGAQIADGSALEYSSDNSAVVSVSSDGVLTAKGTGTAKITVGAHGHNDTVCTVEVRNAPTAVSTATPGDICEGEKRTIVTTLAEGEQCTSFTYISDAPAVVSVDENGVMTAHAKGNANVTVSAYNGVSCTLSVSVGAQPKSVIMDKEKTIYCSVGTKLPVSDNTGSCREFYFTSSDPETVSVKEDGTLTVHKRGTVKITCSTYNGKSAVCTVTAKVVNYKVPYTSDVFAMNVQALAASFPDLISTEVIGKSVLGEDIYVIKLGKGDKKVCVTGGIHPKENITTTYVMRCIEEYAEAASQGKKYGIFYVEKLLNEFTMYLVPLMNPDGLDIHMGVAEPLYTDELTDEKREDYKSNANGVNLNRNSPFMWGEDGVNTTNPDNKSYAGTGPASEPEMQAVINLCKQNDFLWMMNMHSKGHILYYQDKVNEVTDLDNHLAGKISHNYGFTLLDRSNAYEISGGLENWFRSEYGRPSFCIELVYNNYSAKVNEHFNEKIGWNDTKYVLLMCMREVSDSRK